MPPRANPLVRGRVIGDVLDDFVPTVNMMVEYNKMVSNGRTFSPSLVSYRPDVLVEGSAKDYFTLVMTDPDSPGQGEHLHWMVTNIPSISVVLPREELVPYEAPNPTDGGTHRFVFVLFSQKGQMVQEVSSTSRDGFSTRRFAAANELGDPVAAVYFICEEEEEKKKKKAFNQCCMQ
ncbi:Protein TERMINAL FLOWER 1 [Acorus calamus]|uniref:Protein TERMINAL FLOWER 1 n=1 Tax=Acorus calamus TaxID=4465 RepID=A0AAV9DLS2_ACOCL|nr:Protein TERMINAL FLOWER 1 [Acorus calamus]